jgi:uncharacterized delta-60 repeat protein
MLQCLTGLAQFCSPLNTGFGVNGMATNPQLLLNNREYVNRTKIAQGPDGKILQVAHAFSSNRYWIEMQRFLSNGQIDVSFGNNGVVKYDSSLVYYSLNELLYLADGSFLACGYVQFSSSARGWITRFSAAGKEDYEFRSKASGNSLIRDQHTTVWSVFEQSDGRILIAVRTYLQIIACNELGYYPTVFLTRLNPDGSTDLGFGTNGIVAIQSPGIINESPNISVLDNGSIVVACEVGAVCGCVTDAYYGSTYLSCGRQDLLIQRFDVNGVPDLTFGNQGKLVDSSGNFFLSAMKTQSDRKILALSGLDNLNLRRYLPDGGRDPGFGQNGTMDFTMLRNSFADASVELSDFIVQDNGGVVIVGTAFKLNSFSRPIFFRLDQEGKPDTSFSRDGWAGVLESGKEPDAVLDAISIRTGKVFVGGRRRRPDALDEIFVASFADSGKRIYPDISPAGAITLCYNDSLNIGTSMEGTYQWYWYNQLLAGSTKSFINAKNFGGTFAVNVINSSGCGLSSAVSVTTRPENFPGFIQWTGTELVANSGFARYQWYLDNVPVAGANSVRYSPGTTLGSYTFRAWDSFDCSVLSPAFALVITGVSDVTLGDAQIRFFPNPVRADFIIQHRSNSLLRASFELYDQTGRKLLDKTLQSGRNTIDLGSFKNGMYTIILRNGKDQSTQKLMILHD